MVYTQTKATRTRRLCEQACMQVRGVSGVVTRWWYVKKRHLWCIRLARGLFIGRPSLLASMLVSVGCVVLLAASLDRGRWRTRAVTLCWLKQDALRKRETCWCNNCAEKTLRGRHWRAGSLVVVRQCFFWRSCNVLQVFCVGKWLKAHQNPLKARKICRLSTDV